MRRYTAAPDWLRCQASVVLRDGSAAQCMRAKDPAARYNPTGNFSAFCAQHGELYLLGRMTQTEHGSWRVTKASA